jgi:hypothetical protein
VSPRCAPSLYHFGAESLTAFFSFFSAFDSSAMVTSRSQGTNSKERTDDDTAARFACFLAVTRSLLVSYLSLTIILVSFMCSIGLPQENGHLNGFAVMHKANSFLGCFDTKYGFTKRGKLVDDASEFGGCHSNTRIVVFIGDSERVYIKVRGPYGILSKTTTDCDRTRD